MAVVSLITLSGKLVRKECSHMSENEGKRFHPYKTSASSGSCINKHGREKSGESLSESMRRLHVLLIYKNATPIACIIRNGFPASEKTWKPPIISLET